MDSERPVIWIPERQRGVVAKNSGSRVKLPRVKIPNLPISSCITLESYLTFLCLSILIYKLSMIMIRYFVALLREISKVIHKLRTGLGTMISTQ